MKKLLCMLALSMSANVFAQQWVGSSNTNGTISRAGAVSIGGSLQAGSLDVSDNFNAFVRAADFYFGFSGRRGAPGRALVDGTTELHFNYANDWANTVIWGGTVRMPGTLQAGGLDIADNFNAFVRAADFYFGFSGRRGAPGRALVDGTTELHFNFGNDWANTVIGGNIIKLPGKVGIGTDNPGVYKLAVEGTLGARELVATTAPWADFVFKPTYQLRPLSLVESYIQTNGHLPDMPTEEQVTKEGNNLAKTDALLLQKIEELTLYLIEKDKQLQEQNKQIQMLMQMMEKNQGK